MNFRDLPIRDAYDTDVDGSVPLTDFYVPALSRSVQYDRLAGFFSSTALSLSARGIAGLISNGGRMRLVCSPRLSVGDVAVINEAAGSAREEEGMSTVLERAMMRDFAPEELESQLAVDHLAAFAWLLREGHLDMRIVVPRDGNGIPLDEEQLERSGLFHMKVGVMIDGDANEMSFSGSINESRTAWLRNVEEFKVFRSWVEPHRVAQDVGRFLRYWNDASPRMRSYPLPEAVRLKILSSAPASLEDLVLVPTGEPMPEVQEQQTVRLRSYQTEAVEAWLDADRRGILAMATGAGKTITAAICMKRLLELNGQLLAVVAVPQKHLASQWKKSLEQFFPADSIAVAHSDSGPWQRQVADLVSQVLVGTRPLGLVITTHDTAVAPRLRAEIERARGPMLVSDEVHAQGAPEARRGLLDVYSARLGLSATPIRAHDEEGSDLLLEYFGGIAYRFEIEDALKTIDPDTGLSVLSPYYYHARFLHLTTDELERYLNLTRSMVRQFARASNETERRDVLTRIMAERANVTKKAHEKLAALDEILGDLGSELRHCLIYCQDEEQLSAVRALVDNRELLSHRFTGRESASPSIEHGGLSEREWILDAFASGRIQVLLAMKCLDEGVDVPEARTGIILASSQSEREYVQRRGRLLRRCEGKDHADVYDLIVSPSGRYRFDPELDKAERKIFEVELKRAKDFARLALNRTECVAGLIAAGNVGY